MSADKIVQENLRHAERLERIERQRIDEVLTDEKAAQRILDENERHSKNVAHIEQLE